MDYAFKFIVSNGGIDTEEDWGYYSGWGFGTWCNARKQKDRCARARVDAAPRAPRLRVPRAACALQGVGARASTRLDHRVDARPVATLGAARPRGSAAGRARHAHVCMHSQSLTLKHPLDNAAGTS